MSLMTDFFANNYPRLIYQFEKVEDNENFIDRKVFIRKCLDKLH